MHVGDAALALEDPRAFELDVLGTEVVEEAASVAEENRDEVDLDFVEDAGGERELRGGGAVDQHVLVAGRLLGLGHRGGDVRQIGDQRPVVHLAVGLMAAEDEDRHAVVVVTAPATGGLEGPAAGHDRTGGHELVEDLPVDARGTRDTLVAPVRAREDPVVEAMPAVAEAVPRSCVRPGDEPVERHGHGENGCGHGVSLAGIFGPSSWRRTGRAGIDTRVCHTEPHGSVFAQRRPRVRGPGRPHPARRARTARRRQRDDHRARRALRYVADRDEEARRGTRGGAPRHHGEGRPRPQLHTRAVCLRGHQHVAAASRSLRPGCRTHQRSTMSTTVTTPHELEIRVERVFNAPRAHVYSVWTDPELIPEWWGDGTVVEEMDVRAGGTYRFRTAHGVVDGEFRELEPPERLVQTFQNHLQTLEFEDLGEQTKLTQTMRFETTEERDTTMQYGVEEGAKSGFARIDALLQRLTIDAS